MNNELSEPLYKVWVKASRLKSWEVADLIEKAIRINNPAYSIDKKPKGSTE